MKILLQKPPNYEAVATFFNLPPDKAVFFTYGDTVYNPSLVRMTEDLIRHEETHVEQQHADPEVAKEWWARYLKDPVWRIEQEAEAYGAQYAFACQRIKDRNQRDRYLREIAKHLSGPVYGNAISHMEAMKIIRQFAENGRVIHNHIMQADGTMEKESEQEKQVELEDANIEGFV